ncbi:hypothetical protein MKW94_030897 [Papaver nudicaule]|uniref:BZIP domain-containing protein n=1 Tax=Papaver nudicaule TaxID=74823 RepID=A0AA42AVH4_PAPNU|nr:hypothetical protein [Papaver nudicaule]
MDDEELDFSNQVFKSMEHPFLSSCSMDSFFNDIHILDNTHDASTHAANTSNPSEQGMPQYPELPHTPNDIRFDTKTVPVEDKSTTEDTYESVSKRSKKRPPGNKESVRKYRERKKARQALTEDELIKMRIVNQQLLKRLQGLVALEQQIARFKCLLVDIRGRIKGELGSFPYQKPTNGNGVIPQNMPQPSSSVGAYLVNQCDHQFPGLDNNISGCKEFLQSFGQANVRSNTDLTTATAAKKQKGRSLHKCLNEKLGRRR